MANPFSPPAYPSLGLERVRGDATDGETQRDQADDLPASALAGLSIQQMVDLDVEQLAIRIDKHHNATKNSILDNMLEVKAKLLAAQAQAVEEERRGNKALLAAKQAEIDLLRFELHQMTSRANKLTEVARRLAAAFHDQKHRRQQAALFVQAFYAWRQRAIVERQRRQRRARAELWYTQGHLMRNVLRAWFRTAMQGHRVTVNARAAAAVDAARQALAAQAQAAMDELRRQLAGAHAALAQERGAREKLEEDMKQAFMRGVCALNIEAMGIMKRGQQPQEGAPPNPMPPAPAPAAQHSPSPAHCSPVQAAPAAQQQAAPVPQAQARAAGAGATASPPARAPQAAGAQGSSPPPPLPAGGGAQGPAAVPSLAGSAQQFYRRVVVERGPAAGEAPKPRPMAPTPTSRHAG